MTGKYEILIFDKMATIFKKDSTGHKKPRSSSKPPTYKTDHEVHKHALMENNNGEFPLALTACPEKTASLSCNDALKNLARILNDCLTGHFRCHMVRPDADGALYIDLIANKDTAVTLICNLTGSGMENNPLGLVRTKAKTLNIPKSSLTKATERIQTALNMLSGDPCWYWLQPAGPETGNLRQRILASTLAGGFTWYSYRFKAIKQLCEHSLQIQIEGPKGTISFALRDTLDGVEGTAEKVSDGPGFGLWIVQDFRPPESRNSLEQQPEKLVGFLVQRALAGLKSRPKSEPLNITKQSDKGLYLFLNRNLCDLNCIFCSRGRQEWKQRVQDECRGFDYQAELVSFKNLIEKYPDKRQFQLGGHEPALYPTLLPLVKAAKQAKFKEIILETNGVALADPGLCAKLKDAGLNKARLPIYGASQAVHDSITGVKGSKKSVLKAIENLRAIGIRVKLKTVLMRQNMAEMHDIKIAHPKIGCALVMPISDDPNEYIRFCPRFSELSVQVLKMIGDIYLPCIWPFDGYPEKGNSPKGDGFLLGYEGNLIYQNAKGKLSPEQMLQLKIHPPRCKTCRQIQKCSGMYGMYFEAYGVDELKPF